MAGCPWCDTAVAVTSTSIGVPASETHFSSINGVFPFGLMRHNCSVALARKLGFAADYRMATGTDVVETAVELCKSVKKEFPKSTVFSGKLAFKKENFFHKMLHNQTAFAIQNKLHWDEVASVILPIRMTL